MRGAGGDLISPAGVENIRGGKHRCCLCRKKNRALIAPTQIFKSTRRADDAVRDLGGIFADLAMPAVVAFAGPSVLIHFYALSILDRVHDVSCPFCPSAVVAVAVPPPRHVVCALDLRASR